MQANKRIISILLSTFRALSLTDSKTHCTHLPLTPADLDKQLGEEQEETAEAERERKERLRDVLGDRRMGKDRTETKRGQKWEREGQMEAKKWRERERERERRERRKSKSHEYSKTENHPATAGQNWKGMKNFTTLSPMMSARPKKVSYCL